MNAAAWFAAQSFNGRSVESATATPVIRACKGPYCTKAVPVLAADEENRAVEEGFCSDDCALDHRDRFDDSPHGED